MLCAPSQKAWRRSFAGHFGGGASALAAPGDAPCADRPNRVLLLGPGHFPLRDMGSALVQQTKDVLDLRVHTASALPLAPHSALLREDLSYVLSRSSGRRVRTLPQPSCGVAAWRSSTVPRMPRLTLSQFQSSSRLQV